GTPYVPAIAAIHNSGTRHASGVSITDSEAEGSEGYLIDPPTNGYIVYNDWNGEMHLVDFSLSGNAARGGDAQVQYEDTYFSGGGMAAIFYNNGTLYGEVGDAGDNEVHGGVGNGPTSADFLLGTPANPATGWIFLPP